MAFNADIDIGHRAREGEREKEREREREREREGGREGENCRKLQIRPDVLFQDRRALLLPHIRRRMADSGLEAVGASGSARNAS